MYRSNLSVAFVVLLAVQAWALPSTLVKNVEIFGKKYHPGSSFKYSAWAPEGLKENAAVYVLLEQTLNPKLGLDDEMERMMSSGEIPPGLVIYWPMAGTLPATLPRGNYRLMRATELDQIGTEFPNFLVEELIPDAASRLSVTIHPSPDFHFVTGGSSGGLAAWNACWFRNDFFRRTFLSSPTFSAIRGGEELLPIVRKSETRPIKIFMTVGTNEPDYWFGDSFLVAMNAAGAFKYAGYDYHFEVLEHGVHCEWRTSPGLWRQMMPWLFEGWKTNAVVTTKGNPSRVAQILAHGSKWELCDFKMPPPVRETRSTDKWRLYSVAPDSRFVTAESILPDGSRAQCYPLATLHLAWNARHLGGLALTLLQNDRILVATDLGVQGAWTYGFTDVILPLPGDLPAENITVVDKTLYVSSGDKVFKRQLAFGPADPDKIVAPPWTMYGDEPYNREHLPIPELIKVR